MHSASAKDEDTGLGCLPPFSTTADGFLATRLGMERFLARTGKRILDFPRRLLRKRLLADFTGILKVRQLALSSS